jgi:4-amino-4-deoxychorismate lyase
MFRLVESIQIRDGQIPLLLYHEARANRTRKALMGVDEPLHIGEAIHEKGPFQDGHYKCRVVYNEKIEEIIVQEYQIREIKALRLVEGNGIRYDFKYLERPALDILYQQRDGCDEIMIVKEGLITDAFYYNFIFEKAGRWFTPKTPLLEGCRRAALIDSGVLRKADIRTEQMCDYDRIHLINAMTEPGKIVITPDQIHM